MSKLFPEIDGLEETPSEVRNAGPQEILMLQELLGLPGPFAGCQITKARLEDDLLRVFLEGPRLGKLGLIFSVAGVEGAIPCGPGLSLRYVGSQLTQPLKFLIRHITSRMRGVSFEQIARKINTPAKAASSLPDNETSFGFSYASDLSWRTFFEGQESYRGYCGGISGRIASVHHADNECTASNFDIFDGTMNFFNFMRLQRPTNQDSGIFLETDLEDLDVIKGGDRKLDEVLDQLADKQDELDAVMVMSTCISLVTGDDMDGAAAKLESKIKLPVISVGNSINPPAELFRLLRQRPGFLREAERQGRFNLVGYAELPGQDDLFSILSSVGIHLRARLLPAIDVEQLRTCLAAELLVLYPCAWQAQGYRPMLQGIDLPSIQPLPPFGVEGSRRWLMAIAEALGRQEDLANVLPAHLAELSAGWEALQAEAREMTLGLVVDGDALRKLREPEKMLGVPLVPILREMGFKLEFLRHVHPWEEGKRSEQEGGAVRIEPFSSPAELEARLRASPALAFFSDVAFDRRLTRTGKNVFSLRDLEMGPAGAVRSLKRLLGRCRMPFFRKYSAFLGRPMTPRLERGE